MSRRWLTALPVYNEARYVDRVLDQVRQFSPEILVVDDGSQDDTPRLLAARRDVHIVRHPCNLGYGAALRSAFQYAIRHQYDRLVTIDCDGQHEPQRIPRFAAACHGVDIVSGSRYLRHFSGDSRPPAQRQWINQHLTAELNHHLGLQLTDAFCGFKAYRVDALRKLTLTEDGYGMPLELWVQAAYGKLKIVERPVPLIYLDDTRSFGGALDDATSRLEYYRQVISRSLAAVSVDGARVSSAACGDGAG